jgi:UDP-N-acetylglucosamine 2-epimerase (non-hydrolysing)
MRSTLTKFDRRCRLKILTIVGTRPEAIKMLPLIRGLRRSKEFELVSLATGQHREMLHQVFSTFDEKPDIDLDLMKDNQSLTELTSSVLSYMSEIYRTHRPDLVLVQGDTTTAMTAAMGAFYARIPVGHVEAGLRSGDLAQPWPEEFNRVMIDSVANLLFAPTAGARDNLLREYNQKAGIYVTGNTGIDTLFLAAELIEKDAARRSHMNARYAYLSDERRLILVTGHRRENIGSGFEGICEALLALAARTDVQILYPVHLNPNVRETVMRKLNARANILLIDPVDFLDMVYLMQKAYFIITDSGGIQEEAPSLGKPVLVTRNTTERPEAVLTGNVKLVGTDANVIYREAVLLLDDTEVYAQRARPVFPYGDGKASQRIIRIMSEKFASSQGRFS